MGGKAEHINGQYLLQRSGGLWAADADLPHVRDIKQTDLLAGMAVLCYQALGILHRHVVACELHHAGSQRQVQSMQGRGTNFGRGRGNTAHKLVILCSGVSSHSRRAIASRC